MTVLATGSSSAAVAGLLRRILRGRPIKPHHEIAAIIATMTTNMVIDTKARVWMREHIAPIWPHVAGFHLSHEADKQAREIIAAARDGAHTSNTLERVQVLAASLPAHGYDLELGVELPVGPYWDGVHGWQTWREHAGVTRVHVLVATPDGQLWGLADMYKTATTVRLLTAPHPELCGFLINARDLVIASQ